MTGLFITLEGTEGVGKSTQLAFVHDFYTRQGRKVVQTREPGGTPIGEAIRELVLDKRYTGMAANTELLLMFAARAEHLDKVILPALKAGYVVISDRFTDASYAYQGVGRGLSYERIDPLANWTLENIQPDLTLLLDAPVELGLQRAAERSEKDRFESEKSTFFEKIRASYLELADRHPHRIKVIDATQAIDQVSAQISEHLHALG